MLLIADSARHDKTAAFKPCELALGGSGARPGVPDQFRGINAPVGLAEKHTENALLCLREQRIRETLATGPTRSGH